ncbi:hypothetical protein NQ317_004666 [Molorchus minor]|uniref:2-methoxy-6-polyprenyl-1,4-benzoquinol methylase, mitochondrial n=1 Tax=Molorchus minor TaxID=1323400 RepID=A0ABQ9J3V2_9CUCU|nr:hypothetical protein NQ317_004666 [Molorchus minor]
MSQTLQRLLSRTFIKTRFRGIKLLTTQQTFDRNEQETHFGFETVKESEKEEKVHKVFENVAADYDIMSDAMSLGIHRIWKDYFMCRLSPVNNTKLLDMAGGNGDIAFRFINSVKNSNIKDCHVTVCDINANMLEVGKIRSKKSPPQS